ncbi:MAG: S-layer protein [Candidatus Micrarchaeota archaeon]|nr:S-layer protein [Candidatus Micrarchaeota archaeon]
MKSLNVKKIAAFAAGAALIGTALAGAAVTVDENLGNFAFLQNGEPQVKVVVGTNALASDAVWAGNIAAALANMAYTTQEVAAEVPAAGAGTTVAAVSVQVANSGTSIPAGTFGVSSFFASDRLDNSADNTYNASPTRPTIPSALAATKQVSSSQWPSLVLPNNGVLQLSASSTNTQITEAQYINVYSEATYDTSLHAYTAPGMWGALRYTFSTGLPYCVKVTATYGACATGDRIFDTSNSIYFLGQSWVVSGMTLSGTTVGTPTDVQVGKSYASRQRLMVGETLNLSNGYKVKITNVGSAETATNQIPCEISITKPDGTVSFDKLGGSDSATKKVGGISVRLDSATNAGAAGSSSCIVSAYSDVLTLAHGNAIDASLYGSWYANLTTANYSTQPAVTDITLYNTNIRYPTSGGSTAKAGESLTIIDGAPGYSMTFRGMSDLASTDMDTLSIQPYTVSGSLWNGSLQTTSGSQFSLNFHSSRADAWRIVENGVTKNVQDMYVVIKNSSAAFPANWTGAVLYYNGTYYVNLTNISSTAEIPQSNNTANQLVVNLPPMYYSSGSGTDTNVRINVTFAGIMGTNGNDVAQWSGNATQVNVTIPEILNESTGVADGRWNLFFTMASVGATNGNFYNTPTATTQSTINYTAVNRPGAETGAFTPPFCSPRGSCVNSVSTASVSLSYAQKLGHAQFVLSSAGTNLSTGGSTTVMCTPGVACAAAGGITLPVGTGASTASSQQVMTRLNTAVAPLVVLDSEASSTQPLIVVGGPFVNSVAASMEAASLFDACDPSVGGDAFVQIEGNKVLVAGCSADDTVAAARDLIGFLASWTPSAPVVDAE